VREKSEALRSFDPGFAANSVFIKHPFQVYPWINICITRFREV
jgi:hypothetical protein